MKPNNAAFLASAAAGALAMMWAPGAAAQSTATTTPQTGDGTSQAQTTDQEPQAAVATGDIIVTAQKRSENVQKVPIAVQVLSSGALTAGGIRDFTDLGKVAPSLVIRPGENPTNASVSIRGIGTFAFSVAAEPSTAVQVDDVPLGFQARAFADLQDVERIEILRGPQSTLYGKSASAGLINIVTASPTKSFTAKVNGLLTSDDEYQAGATVSGPLSSNLGLRISANHNQFNGNIRNVFNGEKSNGRRNDSIRGKLVWDSTPNLRLTGELSYLDGKQTVGRPFFNVAQTARLRGIASFTPAVFLNGIVANQQNSYISDDTVASTKYKDFAQSLKIEWDLGGPTLMSITAHDSYRYDDIVDGDESAINDPRVRNVQFGYSTSEQTSEEIRLVSPSDTKLRYTAGLFYAYLHNARRLTRGPAFSLTDYLASATFNQYAGFAQLEWEFLPSTFVVGGARYQHNSLDYEYTNYLTNSFLSGGTKESFGTFRAGLRHEFSADFMTYASYATGYKGKAYDITSTFDANRAASGPVSPEKSKAWEIGGRTQFLDRRLTFNVTAFNTTYDNFQAQGVNALADGSLNYTLTNVGKLRTRGVELESSVRIGQGLRLGGSAAYTDARILSFPKAQCYPLQTVAQGCQGTPASQNLAGARPPQAPVWKLAGNFEYVDSLGTRKLQGVLQGSLSYQTKLNYSLSQDPGTIQRAYATANLSVGFRIPSENLEVIAFVNNITDKQYAAYLFNNTVNYANNTAVQAFLPRDFRRYFGVRFSKGF